MKIGILLLWAAALAAQPRQIPFGPNVLHADRGADLMASAQHVELKRGAVTYRIADSGAPPIEIATPSVTVQPYFMGDCRVEVNRRGETIITPAGGDVKVSTPYGVEWVPVGKRMIARTSRGGPEFRIVSAVSVWQRFLAALRTASQNANVAVDAGGGGDSSDSSKSDNSSKSSSSTVHDSSRTASGPASSSPGASRDADSSRSSSVSRGK